MCIPGKIPRCGGLAKQVSSSFYAWHLHFFMVKSGDETTYFGAFYIITVGGVTNMGMGQNLVPLVNIKIAGKWMFIPLKMVLIGIDS